MAKLMKQDGTVVRGIIPDNGTNYRLKELYKLLECDLIDYIRLSPTHIMIIDDEGKLNSEKTLNRPATILARRHRAIYSWDYIAGHVLVCLDGELQ